MKIIAFYLPQFHSIPENDEWWGKDFTDWVNVRKAKPLFNGHYQPRVPKDDNYYDLSNIEAIRWQSNLAEKYGIYGFCFYHYWFNGKLLLEKPVELYRDDPACKTKYCLCWANEDWTDQWYSDSPRVLIRETYGGEKEWEEHFDYFLSFFKDERYIVEDGKPFLVLYEPSNVKNLEEMISCWRRLAVENGFSGLTIAAQNSRGRLNGQVLPECIDYQIDYQPQYAYSFAKQKSFPMLRKCKRNLQSFLRRHFNSTLIDGIGSDKKLAVYDYDEIWKIILDTSPQSDKCIPGAFVDWDNTARKESRGFVINGATPEKFENYLKEQIQRAKMVYHKDKIFLFAWNEWAEGGYLEPDERYGYKFLESVRKALQSL